VTRGRKATTGKRVTKKLKLRAETVRDLDVASKGKDIKGGCTKTLINQATCFIACRAQ